MGNQDTDPHFLSFLLLFLVTKIDLILYETDSGVAEVRYELLIKSFIRS